MVWVSGQKLQDGKYTIEKKLGQGGFGITYLAKDRNSNLVVIKTLKETDIDSEDFDKTLQDFINEAIKLAKCSHHSHIVNVYECIKDGDKWGMVMEYIEGKEIGQLGILPESQALVYIQQVGDALIVVHKNGILHRDVTPKNILVRNNKPEAVLIDFGIARDFTPNLTQTHTDYKSPFYAPIEQYNKRTKRGAYTDVYSLAATLYKLLTGHEPESAISRMMGEPLKPPIDINSSISARVNQAILIGLELKPENRPQSVQEWLHILKNQPVVFIENENKIKAKNYESDVECHTVNSNPIYLDTEIGNTIIGENNINLLENLSDKKEIMWQIAKAINTLIIKIPVCINEVPTSLSRALQAVIEK